MILDIDVQEAIFSLSVWLLWSYDPLTSQKSVKFSCTLNIDSLNTFHKCLTGIVDVPELQFYLPNSLVIAEFWPLDFVKDFSWIFCIWCSYFAIVTMNGFGVFLSPSVPVLVSIYCIGRWPSWFSSQIVLECTQYIHAQYK